MKKKCTLNNIKALVIHLDEEKTKAIKGGQHGEERIDFTPPPTDPAKGGCPPPFEED